METSVIFYDNFLFESKISRYFIKVINEEENKVVLCHVASKKVIAYYEALFDLINEAHIQTQHGGRDIMMDHLKHYFGIPR